MPGNIYSRFTNPTVRAFEERLAAARGRRILRRVRLRHGRDPFHLPGAVKERRSHRFVAQHLRQYGIVVQQLPRQVRRRDELRAADGLRRLGKTIRPNTKLLFLETPSNPTMEIADIARLAKLAHSKGCLLVVDNVFCTPALQRPLEFGADIAVHSATKYLDGQGRCVGGAVVGNKELVGKEVYGFLRTCGPSLSPFNAWVFLKGLETLSLRMKAHSASALVLAQWLEKAAQGEARLLSGAGVASAAWACQETTVWIRRHRVVRCRRWPESGVARDRLDPDHLHHRQSGRRQGAPSRIRPRPRTGA